MVKRTAGANRKPGSLAHPQPNSNLKRSSGSCALFSRRRSTMSTVVMLIAILTGSSFLVMVYLLQSSSLNPGSDPWASNFFELFNGSKRAERNHQWLTPGSNDHHDSNIQPQEPSPMFTVLVTSARTFVGSAVAVGLKQAGHEVYAIDAGCDDHPPFDHVGGDIPSDTIEDLLALQRIATVMAHGIPVSSISLCNNKELRKLVDMHTFTHVFHNNFQRHDLSNDHANLQAASHLGVECFSTLLDVITKSVEQRNRSRNNNHHHHKNTTTIDNNDTNGNTNDDTTATNLPQLILGSSRDVYSDNFERHYEGENADQPVSVSGAMSRTIELIAEAFHETHLLPVVCLRMFEVYGPQSDHTSWMYKVAESLADRTQPDLGLPPDELDFIYISDVVDLVSTVMRSGCRDYCIVNAGTGIPTRLADVVTMMMPLLPKGFEMPRIFETESNLGRAVGSVANLDIVSEVLQWYPRVKLKEGVYKWLRWFKTRRKADHTANLLLTHRLYTPISKSQTADMSLRVSEAAKSDMCAKCVIMVEGIEATHSNTDSENLSLFSIGRQTNRSLGTRKIAGYKGFLEQQATTSRDGNVVIFEPTAIGSATTISSVFSRMDVLGNVLLMGHQYVGVEESEIIAKATSDCFSTTWPHFNTTLRLNGVFNDFHVAGSKTIVLEFLERLETVLNNVNNGASCYREAVNFVAHKHFSSRVYVGDLL
eukprot:m.212707 g.212707  ORF g.212707 m.212707 type:complete len:707 (-) comp33133_c0_seq1:220-2340(-)